MNFKVTRLQARRTKVSTEHTTKPTNKTPQKCWWKSSSSTRVQANIGKSHTYKKTTSAKATSKQEWQQPTGKGKKHDTSTTPSRESRVAGGAWKGNAIYLKLLTGQSVMQFIHINFRGAQKPQPNSGSSNSNKKNLPKT